MFYFWPYIYEIFERNIPYKLGSLGDYLNDYFGDLLSIQSDSQ